MPPDNSAPQPGTGLHQQSRSTHYRYCIEHGIGTLVVGHNPDWKQSINIGQRNHQNFVLIPHVGLRHKLKRLYQRYGIQYTEQEEPYTSKASFLDNDEIPNWLGESKEYEVSDHRVHRGLYKLTPTVSGAPARVRGS